MNMTIKIPADNDGYVLLQCPLCGEYLKISADNCEDDSVLELRCPFCAMVSDNYFTDSVIKLAQAVIQNYAMDLIHEDMKKPERTFSGGLLILKAGKKPEKTHENPTYTGIDTLKIHRYLCCGRNAKIKPLLHITGSYCPFCGVKE
jgi:predicted RNA-binding Zn-ribbon protein involved in translation (DUF1610 family)